jgi:hypothetical protein
MTCTAATLLADVPPVTVTLGRILYHPEAIMLGVVPAEALQPLRDAALQATRLAAGSQETDAVPARWTPHITICCSISDRPAQPLIDALGVQPPEHSPAAGAWIRTAHTASRQAREMYRRHGRPKLAVPYGQ